MFIAKYIFVYINYKIDKLDCEIKCYITCKIQFYRTYEKKKINNMKMKNKRKKKIRALQQNEQKQNYKEIIILYYYFYFFLFLFQFFDERTNIIFHFILFPFI